MFEACKIYGSFKKGGDLMAFADMSGIMGDLVIVAVIAISIGIVGYIAITLWERKTGKKFMDGR